MLNPITDLSALAEQLCRVEHKLDLIIRFLAMQNGEFELIPMKEGIDPLSHERVQYYMDLMKRHVVRISIDGTGLIPPSSILFSPVATQETGNNNGGNEGGNVG